jgi:hypothetical protein
MKPAKNSSSGPKTYRNGSSTATADLLLYRKSHLHHRKKKLHKISGSLLKKKAVATTPNAKKAATPSGKTPTTKKQLIKDISDLLPQLGIDDLNTLLKKANKLAASQ